jgi:hypothetical protein
MRCPILTFSILLSEDSSGSGKATFLNDVHKSQKCPYIRQHHNIRPYVVVSKIPNFNPKGLPYWDICEREGKHHSGWRHNGRGIYGWTISGGQSELLLFELNIQHVKSQKDLFICLDEPATSAEATAQKCATFGSVLRIASPPEDRP